MKGIIVKAYRPPNQRLILCHGRANKYWIRNQGFRIARLWISTNSRRSIGSDKRNRSNSFSSDSLGSRLMVTLGRSCSPEKNPRQRRGGRQKTFFQSVASSRPRIIPPGWWALCCPGTFDRDTRPSNGLLMASGGSGSDQRGLRPMGGTIGRFSDDYGTVLDLVRLCPKPHSHSGEKQKSRKFTDVFNSAQIGLLIRWSWVRVPAASLGRTPCRRLG